MCDSCGSADDVTCEECDTRKANNRHCGGKVCYTEREAGAVINSAKRSRSGIRRGERVNVRSGRQNIPKRKYHCPVCGMWHVTHYSYYNDKE